MFGCARLRPFERPAMPGSMELVGQAGPLPCLPPPCAWPLRCRRGLLRHGLQYLRSVGPGVGRGPLRLHQRDRPEALADRVGQGAPKSRGFRARGRSLRLQSGRCGWACVWGGGGRCPEGGLGQGAGGFCMDCAAVGLRRHHRHTDRPTQWPCARCGDVPPPPARTRGVCIGMPLVNGTGNGPVSGTADPRSSQTGQVIWGLR